MRNSQRSTRSGLMTVTSNGQRSRGSFFISVSVLDDASSISTCFGARLRHAGFERHGDGLLARPSKLDGGAAGSAPLPLTGANVVGWSRVMQYAGPAATASPPRTPRSDSRGWRRSCAADAKVRVAEMATFDDVRMAQCHSAEFVAGHDPPSRCRGAVHVPFHAKLGRQGSNLQLPG